MEVAHSDNLSPEAPSMKSTAYDLIAMCRQEASLFPTTPADSVAGRAFAYHTATVKDFHRAPFQRASVQLAAYHHQKRFADDRPDIHSSVGQ